MSSRDIWQHGNGRQLHDLLASALLTLMFPSSETLPIYFASPWMSDFRLFENGTREVSDLFPSIGDQDNIAFVEFLGVLQQQKDVRIITVRNSTSNVFIERLRSNMSSVRAVRLRVRLASQETHEKGILAPAFYIDGSMNITHMGVHVNGEKIAYHVRNDEGGTALISKAYLEFGRRWESMQDQEVVW